MTLRTRVLKPLWSNILNSLAALPMPGLPPRFALNAFVKTIGLTLAEQLGYQKSSLNALRLLLGCIMHKRFKTIVLRDFLLRQLFQ